ncbi:uncharacterized protein LOC112599999 [Melanaphis sacchari]|uniref:uncharacterized protein LOC112599999 n=1 Tax=Melanaphis sacchari TaxID=742174 RepID=UPI000DC159D3|nr:uncharacterized protein LOC112599999 [Melanaphis sacchari]
MLGNTGSSSTYDNRYYAKYFYGISRKILKIDIQQIFKISEVSNSKVSSKKRKRIKLECLICGSVFDDDYRSKHENNIHGGKRVRVKHGGAPNNPFDLARQISKHKLIKSDLTSELMTEETDTDLKSSKEECPIFPNTTCDKKIQNSPMSVLSETITSGSMVNLIISIIYCFPCRHFTAHMISPGEVKGNIPFIDYGLKCWKEPRKKFTSHSHNKRHIICMERWNDYMLIRNNNKKSISYSLNVARVQDITENRKHIMFLLKATLFLAKQGLAFRGHNETDNSNNKGNFIQLLEMFADESLAVKLKSRYGHYTSPEYQNDLIHIIASLDETKDISKKEQLSFVLRFVDSDYNVHESAIGCYHMKKSDAETQCYDGANVMSGSYSGVQKRIQAIVPHSLDEKSRILSTGLLKEISSFNFILILCTMEKILEVIHCASCELQNSSLLLPVAINLIKCTKKNLLLMLSDGVWITIEKLAHDKAVKNRIEEPSSELRPQRIKHFNKNLNEYHVTTTAGQTNPSIKIELLYTVIDRFTIEMDNRFSEETCEILMISEIFNPSTKSLIERTNMQKPDIHFILKTLSELPSAFTETLKILTILLTLPVTTATNERFFSSLKRVKSFLRSTTGDDRLSDLMVINVEGEYASHVNLEEAVDMFANIKNRRYPLIL